MLGPKDPTKDDVRGDGAPRKYVLVRRDVREIGSSSTPTPTTPLALPSKPLVAQLNVHWRIIDDPDQWILQRRRGNARSKNSGWRGRSFCRTREALLRCVREHCGEVASDALAVLQSLPSWHVDR
jgi:hypothetical protein